MKSRSRGLLFVLAKINKGIRTRREQTQSAEENSPADWFCRRGQGAKRREGARECTEKIPNSPPRSAVVHDTMGYRTFLFFCRRSPYIKRFSEYGGAKVLNARIFLFYRRCAADFCFAPPNEKNQIVDRFIKRLQRKIKFFLDILFATIFLFPRESQCFYW